MRRNMLRKIVIIAFIAVVGAPVEAGADEFLIKNPEVSAAIAVFDAWCQYTVSYREQPAVSVGIVHDQDLIWAKGYGYADLQNKIPTTPRTVYRIASITKLFTATAILHLRDAGKLQLDDPVVKYLDWFQPVDTFYNSPIITIRHLLTHTSGLQRELNETYWDSRNFPEHEDFVRMFQETSTILPRETEYKYSNIAFNILGEIITTISGEFFADYIGEHVLKPLGMTSSTLMPQESMAMLARGYGMRDPEQPRRVESFYDKKAMAASGNMVSTVEDLAKFISLQFRDSAAGGAQILKGSTLREMHRVHWLQSNWKRGRGLGWIVANVDGQTRINHGGFVPGYKTHISVEPSNRIGIIVLTNSDDGDPQFYLNQAWNIIAPAIKKATARAEQTPVPDSSWIKYIGDYEWSDIGGLIKVMLLNGELTIIELPDDNPWKNRIRLEPVSENIFRMKDQWQKGELIRFEMNDDGEVTRIILPGYSIRRK
ncbi:MAG: serine hydrolase [candidate division Zixibacteria bacterium]